MMHRNKIQPSKLPINRAHQLANLSLQLRTIAQRGARHLYQHNIADPLRVVLEQLRERAQLLHDAFHDVELVPPDDDLFAGVELEEGGEFGLDVGAGSVIRSYLHNDSTISLGPQRGEASMMVGREIGTYKSFCTLSASTPTGQCFTAVTCPCTSIPLAAISYPQTLTQEDVKWREYEYVWKQTRFAPSMPSRISLRPVSSIAVSQMSPQ